MLVKSKVFHGKACEVAKLLIDDLLHEQWQISVITFKEMIDQTNSKAYLSHHCYNKARKCVDQIDAVRKSAIELLIMALKLMGSILNLFQLVERGLLLLGISTAVACAVRRLDQNQLAR